MARFAGFGVVMRARLGGGLVRGLTRPRSQHKCNRQCASVRYTFGMTSPRKRKTHFTTVSLTPEARDALQATTIALTTEAGRRLSMSDTLIALCTIAPTHHQELLNALN